MQSEFPRRGVLGLMAGAGALAIARPAAAAVSPEAAAALIRRAVDEVYGVINSGLPEAQMLARFTTIFARHADVDVIARSALGPAGRSAPAAPYKRYRDAFVGYIGRKYGRRFHEFIGGRIEIDGARPLKSFIEVRSTAHLRGQAPFAVDWHVSDKSGSPKFFNLIIEGVNMLATERAEITAMLARAGGDLDRLAATLKAT